MLFRSVAAFDARRHVVVEELNALPGVSCIEPGGAFRYTSGANLTTPVGCMEGSYTMIVADEDDVDLSEQPAFEVPIPAFTLHTPTALN